VSSSRSFIAVVVLEWMRTGIAALERTWGDRQRRDRERKQVVRRGKKSKIKSLPNQGRWLIPTVPFHLAEELREPGRDFGHAFAEGEPR
jgi:hypothetical protein